MGSEQQFCLRWHNYQSSLLASLPQLLDGDDLTDCTLMAGGCNLKAHRVVLSACSQYFKELFKVLQPLQHPVVVLPGGKFTDLCALVTFMYSGEVNIYQEQLHGLLAMAEALQIRGLAEVNTNTGRNPTINEAVSKKDSVAAKRSQPSQLPLMDTADDVCKKMMKALNKSSYKQSDLETDLHVGNFNSNPYKESFGNRVETKKKTTRNPIYKPAETSVLNYVEDQLQDSHPDEKNFLLDNNITAEFESALGSSINSALEEMCEMEDGDNHSPSSHDSGPDNPSGGSSAIKDGNEIIQSNMSKLPSTSSSQFVYQACGQIISSKLFATCFICGKQLSNKFNLRVHMETHQNVNYACNVCSHVSRSRDALRKHVSYRHPGEAKEKVNCTEGQAGTPGNEAAGPGRSKKSKLAINKDSNNNKRPHP